MTQYFICYAWHKFLLFLFYSIHPYYDIVPKPLFDVKVIWIKKKKLFANESVWLADLLKFTWSKISRKFAKNQASILCLSVNSILKCLRASTRSLDIVLNGARLHSVPVFFEFIWNFTSKEFHIFYFQLIDYLFF